MNAVYAKDYNILPGMDKCHIKEIQEMFSEHRSETCFVFEPGQYHFYQNNTYKRRYPSSNSNQADRLNIALLLEDMSSITIDGHGADFIFHGDMTPIAVSGCAVIDIENLSIDFAVPLTAEARILRAEQGAVEILLDRDMFPYRIFNETIMFDRGFGQEAPLTGALEFDARTNKVREGAGDTFPKVKAYEAGNDIIRLEGEFHILPKAGNILVLRHGSRIHPGVLVQYSEDITFNNIMVHQTGGLGFLFQFNKDISVSGVSFEANYAKGLKVVNGHDDGLHFSNNRGTITVRDCKFMGLMDDPVNVHGTAVCIVEKSSSNTLRCEYRHPQSAGFAGWAVKGDRVAFIRPDNRMCYAEAEVLEYRLLSCTDFELVLNSPMPSGMYPGDALENLTNTPSLVCHGNYFGSTRARGILVTTPRPVLIEDNVFESSGSAILLAGDVNEWYESGTCEDVVIRRNQFLRCATSFYQFCNAVIDVEPSVEMGQDQIVHHNIRIEDNLFLLSSPALLYADHTGDLILEGNCIYMEEAGRAAEVTLIRCKNAVIGCNMLTGAGELIVNERIG